MRQVSIMKNTHLPPYPAKTGIFSNYRHSYITRDQHNNHLLVMLALVDRTLKYAMLIKNRALSILN